MKKIIYFFILFCLLIFLFWQKDALITNVDFLLAGPCDRPIEFRLGQVDSGYQKSQEVFLAEVEQAAGIWEKATGRDLFTHEPQAEMAVNLIYTQRQSVLDKLGRLENDLGGGKSSLEAMEREFNQLSAAFEARLEKFNQEVVYWNQKKGAPSDVYDRLIKEQSELEQESEKLNLMAQQLNLQVKDYNLQVGEFNRNVRDYNLIAEQRPEAGLYDGAVPKIDIYLTTSEAELIHTLAHEFGHALSLDHVDNPQSIMYPFSSEVIEPAAVELKALELICGQKNWEIYIKVISEEGKKIIQEWGFFNN